jgi:hypothetical protein
MVGGTHNGGVVKNYLINLVILLQSRLHATAVSMIQVVVLGGKIIEHPPSNQL